MRRAPIPESWPSDEQAERARLPEETAHYLRDVLRLGVGEEVELFDGSGRTLRVRIAREDVEILTRGEASDHGESPLRVRLCQAICKGERWEWSLEKAAELGVWQVQPLLTRRTIVQIAAKKLPRKMERWGKILAAGCRQSGRARIPELLEPRGLEEALGERAAEIPGFFLHTGQGLESLVERLRRLETGETIELWIGPEGGFEEAELELARGAGLEAVSMGPRVLRAETAALSALTIAQAICGDLG